MPVHIETHEIRVFHAVINEGGFAKAADKLFVTQSAVSQTIRNLEIKLDTVLLERNPIKLTESGIRLLNYAEHVLGEEDAVLEDIQNIKLGILSTLLLAMSGSVNLLYGQNLLTEFCRGSPLTKLKTNIMPSRQIITAVASDLWELGFGPFQQSMPDVFQLLPLFADERLLVISKSHELAGANSDAILSGVPLIVSHLDDQDMRPTLEKLRDAFGTIWEVSDTNLRIDLVSQGLGMTYLDQHIIDSDSRCRDFVPIPALPFAKIPLQFGVFHRRNKQLSTGASRFMDVCKSFDFDPPAPRGSSDLRS